MVRGGVDGLPSQFPGALGRALPLGLAFAFAIPRTLKLTTLLTASTVTWVDSSYSDTSTTFSPVSVLVLALLRFVALADVTVDNVGGRRLELQEIELL